MPTYDIWCEGYSATGDFSRASKLASGIEAETFGEACDKHFTSELLGTVDPFTTQIA